MIVITSFVIGAPAESPEDMRRTIDFIRALRPHGVQLNALDVLVGTPIWQGMEKEGIIRPDDWKTNHRIYEYGRSSLGKEELEAMSAEGFRRLPGAWKTPCGIFG